MMNACRGTVAGMSLELIGINGEALAIMRECFDWEKEGYIFYTGTIVEELSDIIVNSIEEQGLYTVVEALQLVMDNPDHSIDTQERQIPGVDIENVPPDLLQYFKDTYDQCDIDKNGVLDMTEFLNLILSLDLGLCSSDLDDVQVNIFICIYLGIYSYVYLCIHKYLFVYVCMYTYSYMYIYLLISGGYVAQT
jgi:hypothetical protein